MGTPRSNGLLSIFPLNITGALEPSSQPASPGTSSGFGPRRIPSSTSTRRRSRMRCRSRSRPVRGPRRAPGGPLKMTGARFMAGFYMFLWHYKSWRIDFDCHVLIHLDLFFFEPRLWIGVVSKNWKGYQCHSVTPEMIIASSQQLCLGWPRSWYAQVPAANDLQQESGTTQVAPRISKILEDRFLYFFVGWVHS